MFLYINQKRTENKIRQIINCFLLIHKHLWFNILKQQTKAKNHFFIKHFVVLKIPSIFAFN